MRALLAAGAASLLALAALAFLVKALSILATGGFRFEDVAIEGGVMFAGAGTLALALTARPTGWRTAACVAAGGCAMLAALNLALPAAGGLVTGVLYATSTLALVAALILAGRAGRPDARAWAPLASWTGLLFVPLTLVGGAFSLLHERLLEIGIVAIALLLAALAVKAPRLDAR